MLVRGRDQGCFLWRRTASDGCGRPYSSEIDPAVRVHTAWDLGVSDSTAIWFTQCVGRERRLVDYYELSGVGIDHYAQVLYDKRIKHGWKYGEHFFPHDIVHQEFSTGNSRLDALAALGIQANVVRESSVLDGINEVRQVLGRAWIDPERCERGLEALRQYRREYDERLKDWKANPLHNWASHAANSCGTLCSVSRNCITFPGLVIVSVRKRHREVPCRAHNTSA